MKPRPFVIIPRSCVCSTSAMCAPQGCACGSQAIVIRHDLAEAITSFLELDVCIQAPLNCRANPLAAAHTKPRHHDVSWHTATQPHGHTATQPHPPRYATGRPGEVLQLRNELCSRNAMRGAWFVQADHMSRGCHTSDWDELIGFQIGRSLTRLLLLLLHPSRSNNVLPGRTSIVPPIHNTMWI